MTFIQQITINNTAAANLYQRRIKYYIKENPISEDLETEREIILKGIQCTAFEALEKKLQH
jgi:hypothetical protein